VPKDPEQHLFQKKDKKKASRSPPGVKMYYRLTLIATFSISSAVVIVLAFAWKFL
jgi:hypothetical protein